jgi:hypothetical protein
MMAGIGGAVKIAKKQITRGVWLSLLDGIALDQGNREHYIFPADADGCRIIDDGTIELRVGEAWWAIKITKPREQ